MNEQKKYDPDGYITFEKAHMEWLVAELERIAPGGARDIVAVGRRKAGLDLEILFEVKPRSRKAFTAEVCLNLAKQLAERTGVMAPVVYVMGNPHPAAEEALRYADRAL